MNTQEFEQKVREKYAALTRALIERGLTITTMESATGGQIASLITDTEGASAILKGAFVTYSNEAKIRQGVPEEIIRTYGVYSRETAAAMAKACREAWQADIGIGVTGMTGNPDPANPEVFLPGQVFFAVSLAGGEHCFHLRTGSQPTRLAYKMTAADSICDAVTELLGIIG